MFLKKILLLLSLLTLLGCVQVYIVKNELSESYSEQRNFFSDEYSELKSGSALFYIRIGYYEKESGELIIFLYHDTLTSKEINLTHSELLSNNSLVSKIQNVNNLFVEKKEEIKGVTYFQGGARLAFNLPDIKKILGTDLMLRVYFHDNDANQSTIDLQIHITSERVMPT